MQKKSTREEFEKRLKALERKNAALVSQNHALKESEKKFRALVESSLQSFILMQDTGVVFANAACSALTGYTNEELLSFTPEKIREILHPTERDEAWPTPERQ